MTEPSAEVVPFTSRPSAARGQGMDHGAFDDRVLSTVASEVAEFLFAYAPWVLGSDQVAILQYCRAEARTRLLSEFALKRAAEKGVERVPPYIWQQLTAAENNAMRAADSLGLTPAGRLKISKDAGFAHHFQREKVGELVEQGAAIREKRAGAAPG
jgi:hypothetical protein